MNATAEALAHEREILLARSALCRLRLRRDAQSVRDSLQWRRVAFAAATSPVMPRIVLGLAISIVGFGRASRAVRFAGRTLLLANLACSIFSYARNRAPPSSGAIEHEAPGVSGSLMQSSRSTL